MKSKSEILALLIREGLLDLRVIAGRRWFNAAIKEGWQHAEAHGDVRHLQIIADAYDNRKQRAQFIKKLREHLPIGPSQKNAGRLGIDREAIKNWDNPNPWPDFSVGSLSSKENSEAIRIDAMAVTPVELLSLLTDHIVLNRKSVSLVQIDELITMLESIRHRMISSEKHPNTDAQNSDKHPLESVND